MKEVKLAFSSPAPHPACLVGLAGVPSSEAEGSVEEQEPGFFIPRGGEDASYGPPDL